MSTTAVHRELEGRSVPAVSETSQTPSASFWETLCEWLTRDLRGMMTTIERREKGGDWVVECQSFPMETVTTHMMSNGVRVISVGLRVNGNRKLFEVPGPNSIGVRRNAAGWPIRVELGYEEGQLVLLFSGQMDPARRSSSNTWGE
jgi:hypothetical protein